ncbi:hypothetical protein BDF22DRAFT_694207 [Syncephalis plumigaleata]|nr:hypothetical protein BDF22DRAFT_694207 [Syncephalis plumigaleata]
MVHSSQGCRIYIYIDRIITMCYQFLIILVAWLLQHSQVTDAKLSFKGTFARAVNYTTTDFFLRPQPSANYTGIAMVWEYKYFDDTGRCAFPSLNTSTQETRDLIHQANRYPDFAIILHYPKDAYYYCGIGDDVGEKTNRLFQQLIEAGFPPVNLIILVNRSGEYAVLIDDYMMYNSPSSFEKFIRTTPINVIVVKVRNKPWPDPFIASGNRYYRYYAEPEKNDWNETFLSSGSLSYKCFCFILILLVIMYVWGRIIMLVLLKQLKFNLLLVSFLVTTLYCICKSILEIHFIGSFSFPVLEEISFIYTFLSRLPFDLILWHWSIIGKNLFSRKSIIFFRGIVVADVISNIVRITYAVFFCVRPLVISGDIYRISMISNIDLLCVLVIPFIIILIFGGFIIWFSISAYKLKRHPEGRLRFIQLICFSAVGFSTYIIFLSRSRTWLNGEEKDLRSFAYETEITFDTAYSIRAIVFLLILGVRWPKLEEKTNTAEPCSPLGGMTTVGWEMSVQGEEKTIQQRLTYNFAKMIRSYSSSTAA